MQVKSKYWSAGIYNMLLATLFFASMQALIKELSHFHVFEIVFFRSVITAIVCWGLLKKEGVSLLGKKHGLLLQRALFGIISMTLFFITLQRMPIGASVSLKYLSPIFTAIFAVLLLREHITALQTACFLLALLGVGLLKGFDARIDTLNLVLGILGAAFGGLVYVTIRRIGTSEHPLVIVNYFMTSAAVLAGLAMIPFWQTPSRQEWLLLLLVGSLGFFAQQYMTRAFQLEAASRVAPLKYLEVIYSLLIGLFWFGETYHLLGLAGILLILIGMFGNLIFGSTTKST